MTPTAETDWVRLLERRAAERGGETAFVFLGDGEEPAGRLHFAELHDRARAVAAALQARGLEGERALLLFPPGLDFVVAFFGCLLARVVAVPAYPPRLRRPQPRLQALVRDCRPACVLTTATLESRADALARHVPETTAATWVAVDRLQDGEGERWRQPPEDPDATAFLQYTSGSTGTPRGVVVTHRNLLVNQRMIGESFGTDGASVVVGWLPLYHDMGLIGTVLHPVYLGARCVLMAPAAFLRRPVRWLQAIDRFAGTVSGGPDFAYDLCTRKVADEDLEGLDLSRWSVAFNGAEPVRAATLDAFSRRFAPCGFDPGAHFPCFGLAEATLFVSGRGPDRRAVVRSFDRRALEAGRARDGDGGERAAELVSSGRAAGGTAVVVVDPRTRRPLPDGAIGEIWIRGPHVAGGYWEQPEASRRTFAARLAGDGGDGDGVDHLRTGDLGFLRDGELFVTGRLKDLILVNGRNVYPQDLERRAEACDPSLMAGGAAAFAVEDGPAPRLVVVVELERRPPEDSRAVARRIVRALAGEQEVRVHEVVIVGRGGVPRTSSGKVRRRACRDAWKDGSLPVVERYRRDDPTTAPSAPPAHSAVAGAADPPLWVVLEREVAAVTGVVPEGDAPLATLGVDSLAAAELEAALGARGLEVRTSDLLGDLTLNQLAERIAAGRGAAQSGDESAGEGAEERRLSWGQHGIWLADRLAGDTPVYRIGAAVHGRGALDREALGRVLTALVARHEALRSTFRAGAAGPERRVRPAADAAAAFELVDEGVVEAGGETDLLRRSFAEPLDPATGPLLRVGVARREGGFLLWLVVHHMVADFLSLAILVRELGLLYRQETGGAPAGLSPVVGDGAFIAWQRSWLASPDGRAQEDWWRRALPSGTAPLDLPGDRPRPGTASHRGEAVRLRPGPSLTSAVERLAARSGATAPAVLLAALQTVLHRYSGQERFTVVVPSAGRRQAGFAGTVGYLANLLLVAADLKGRPSFLDHLTRTRRTLLQALDHQDLPFARLAEELRSRGDDPAGLSRVLFVHHRSAGAEDGLALAAAGHGGARFSCGGLKLTTRPWPLDRVEHDLALRVAEGAAGWWLSVEYAVDLFDRTTAERLASHLVRLLESAAAAPERRLSDLELLGAGERVQVTREWSRGLDADRAAAGRPGAGAPSLGAWLGECAAAWPEAVAVEWGALRLSYGELLRRADAVAAALRSRGVGPESRVAVSAGRGAALYVALAGVWRAGAAHVPLDPGYPDERRRFMLEDSGAEVVLAAGETEELPVPVVSLGEAMAAGAEESRPLPAAGPDHLAYVIYTSGSTGRPKGVAIRHGSALELAAWASRAYGRETLAGVLAATSVGFDLSVFEMLAAWGAGGRLVVARDAVALAEMPGAWGVTLVNTVPSAAAELTAAGAVPGSVREMNLAGEPLRRALVEAVHAAGVGAVRNLYGPSEDTTYSTGLVVPAGVAEEPTIGRPLAGSRGYVVDGEGRPVPVGVVGELWLGGPGLARGYLGRPARTAESFVPDGLTSDTSSGDAAPGARLYRTGDLARWRRDGELEFLGRRDHQVKVRGYRIELREVEVAVESHPAVAEAVVVVAGETLAERRLAAYVVLAGGAGEELDGAELRSWLQERVPAYVVPSVFSVLEDFPRTPSGKVDRRSLPAPETGPRQVVAPANELERELAALWAEVLGVGEVGAEDDFFALGGHSLAAVRVASRVRETQGVDLSLRVVFEAPTVRALAARVEARRDADTTAAGLTAPLERADRSRPLPLSWAQERLWFLQRLEPESAAYHLAGALRLRGPVDVAALTSALSAVAARHETLRTAFREVEGVPVQVPLPPAPVPLPRIDLSALPEELRDGEQTRLLAALGRRPFDQSRGRLLRARLLRRAEDDCMLHVTLHHLVADGWSLPLLLREVGDRYAAALRDAGGGRVAPVLPAPARTPADFAAWQRHPAHEPEWQRRLERWRGWLAPPLPAPLSPVVRGVARSGTGRRPVRLAPAALRSLEGAARRLRATPYMVMLAALELLLARLGGDPDAVVGTPVAEREHGELADAVGFLVETVPIRLRAEPHLTGGVWVERVRETVLEAHRHRVPFDRLVAEVAPDQRRRRTPLFQVLFAYLAETRPPPALPGVEAEWVELPPLEAKFDLMLSLRRLPEGAVAGYLEYRRDRFDGATVERWLAAWERLLEGLVEHPETAVGELPLLSPAERKQLVAKWNDTQVEPAPAAPLGRRLGAVAAARPGAVAVEWADGHLSYGALLRRADRVAAALVARGAGPEVPVGVSVERSVELVVALCGVWRSGAPWVSVDPSYPAARRRRMVADSGARQVLVSRRTAALWGDAVAGPEVEVLPVEDAMAAAGVSLPPALPDVAPDGLAYVVYTSGSTGRPKGVGVSHRNLANLAAALEEEVYVGSGAVRCGLSASVGFDASVKQLLQLLAGRTLRPVPEAVRLDGGELARFGRRHRLDVLDLTPSQLGLVLAAGETPETLAPRLLVGGEALEGETWAALAASPAVAYNVYGPCECTVDSTGTVVEGPHPHLGHPWRNLRVHVVDGRGEPVPVGVAGELWIGGAGVSRGYVGDPRRTAERFVPDDLGGAAGARVYRSGDLARRHADGSLESLGRRDGQVQLRGVRLELGEVEAVLRQLPAVRQAVVTVRELQAGHRLVAYLVPADGASDGLAPARLTAHAADRLPEVMVPSAYVVLEALPLTSHGKVDRAALPAPSRRHVPAETSYAAPRTPVERALADLWQELLELPRVGVRDDFFALGGHSLLVTRVRHGVQRELGVDLPLRDVFAAPTVEALARRVEAARQRSSGREPLRPLPPRERWPLSPAQQRLWLLERVAPGQPAYHVAGGLRLQGELRTELLAAALALVVRRHDSLRTAFGSDDGEPYQVVEPAPQPFRLPVVDLAALPPRHRGAELERLGRREARRPFRLHRAPLLRVRLLRAAPRDHRLLLVLHHVISDGWSTELLVREVEEVYRALLERRPAALPELPVRYVDFAVWHRRWLQGEEAAAGLDRARALLEGVPPSLPLPYDRPADGAGALRGSARRRLLPRSLETGATELARRTGVTPFAVHLAAWSALLHRLTGARDFVVGIPVDGRGAAETARLIGFFVNTVLSRARLEGDLSGADLVERTHRAALAARELQDVPLQDVVDALGTRAANGQRVQVLFAWRQQEAAVPDLPGLVCRREPVETGGARFELALDVGRREGRLEARLEIDRDRFDGTTAERWLTAWERLLAALVEHPATAVGELPLLSPAERWQLVAEWNDTAAAPGPVAGLGRRLGEAAAAAPDRVAVEWTDGHLSYGELLRRADRVAAALVSRGVGPEVRVGVSVERSLELLVALCGVWRSGGAYVPVDPAYPAARRERVLSDSGARWVLATRGTWTALRDGPAEVLRVEEAMAGGAGETPQPPVPVEPDNLAYVLYTSGSTGRPKGVGVSHRGLANLEAALEEEVYAGSAAVRCGLSASVGFDASVQQLLQLLAGRTVRPVPEAVRLDGSLLAEFCRRHRLDVLDLTPSQLGLVLAAGEGPEALAPRLLVGGEAVEGEVWAALAGSPATAYNVYGPCECTVELTGPVVSGDVPYLGRPWRNTTLHVVDGRGEPVPVGVVGELWIGGVGVSRGYVGNAAMTAERFVPDALGGAAGSRVYRTGDLARRRGDGVLESLGRRDGQVKLRGVRIELGEVEAVLREHPAVREAVVTLRELEAGHRLVAYLLPVDGTGDGPEPVELAAHAAARLPDSAVPSAYVGLAALPLTAHGKVDRRALPEPSRRHSPAAAGYAAPRTALERVLVDLWQELLQLPRVGIHDDFFALGGHSLLAARLASRVERVLQVPMALPQLLERPTVAGVAEALAGGGQGEHARRMAELYERVAALSEDEVEAMLEEPDTVTAREAE